MTPRGFAGPNLLAMILFEKFAQYQPLNRQSERCPRRHRPQPVDAADQVGACAGALKSRDRRQEHPERHLETFSGILQADAYSGYNPLFKADRGPGPLTQALCGAHSQRE